MKLYSTNNHDNQVSFSEAVLRSLPADKGLYMPINIPKLSSEILDSIESYSFQEFSYLVAQHLIGNAIPAEVLKSLVFEAINFKAPVVPIDDNIYSLELFHGPTLAFKDFGARFMSRVMNYFRDKNKKLYILVATSGDTGGAVASGFFEVEGIQVVILFPKGKVSPLQQKQLTTLGKNITAVEIDGTFDDCQAIVKQAFLDPELTEHYQLSSANSINIARLIPQSFYYFNALKQLGNPKDSIFVVPSGNFGNITAGILAQQMGMKVNKFIAATNSNDVFPKYLNSGIFTPEPSIPTISNAMDVGNPSNFPRLDHLYGSTWNIVKENVQSYAYSDNETRAAMRHVYSEYEYILDPHGAVGYLAAEQYRAEHNPLGPIIVLETAHPSKFVETVEETLNTKIEIPERLKVLEYRKEEFYQMNNTYYAFKNWFRDEF